MTSLGQLELELKPREIIKALFQKCDIKETPTNNQLILDFLNIEKKKLSTFIKKPLEEISTDVRAILDVRQKAIILHDHVEMNKNRHNFSVFHELGHFALPKHNKLLHECSWRDLSSFAKKKLEIEANAFAADCIFQLDRFTNEAADSPITLKTPYLLAPTYLASYEATFRRYVENNHAPCALVVYKPESFDDEPDALVVNYTITSNSFKKFGYLIPGQRINAGDVVAKLFNEKEFGRKDFLETELTVKNMNTGHANVYPTECFSNSYKVFQLVTPRK